MRDLKRCICQNVMSALGIDLPTSSPSHYPLGALPGPPLRISRRWPASFREGRRIDICDLVISSSSILPLAMMGRRVALDEMTEALECCEIAEKIQCIPINTIRPKR